MKHHLSTRAWWSLFTFTLATTSALDTTGIETQAAGALTKAKTDLTNFQGNVINYNATRDPQGTTILSQMNTVVYDLQNLAASVKLLIDQPLTPTDQAAIANAGLDFYNSYNAFYNWAPLHSTLLDTIPSFLSGLHTIQATVVEGMSYAAALVSASETEEFQSILATLQSEAANSTSRFNTNNSTYQLPATTAISSAVPPGATQVNIGAALATSATRSRTAAVATSAAGVSGMRTSSVLKSTPTVSMVSAATGSTSTAGPALQTSTPTNSGTILETCNTQLKFLLIGSAAAILLW